MNRAERRRVQKFAKPEHRKALDALLKARTAAGWCYKCTLNKHVECYGDPCKCDSKKHSVLEQNPGSS